MINGTQWNELTAQQLVRYEALFKLLDEIQVLENLNLISQRVASQWKYFANVNRWRIVLVMDKGFVIIEGSRGEARVTDVMELCPWDFHFCKLQYPCLIRIGDSYDGPKPPDLFTGNDIVEIQVLPFTRMNSCIGLLSVASRHEPFSDIDNKFIRIFGNYFVNRVSDILFRKHATEALIKKAETDSLTGLLNRGNIMEKLENQIIQARRSNEPLSVILADIDFFKAVNDNYGHLVGDDVLTEVAQRLKTQIRTTDFLGRYGGEEFLLVFFPCSKELVAKAAERIRCRIAQTPVCVNTTKTLEIPITISLGTSTLEKPYECNAEMLLARADNALYRSKANGRNCVSSENEMVLSAVKKDRYCPPPKN